MTVMKLFTATKLQQVRDKYGGQAESKLKQQLDAKMAEMQKDLDAELANYAANSDKFNAQAFMVMDASKDGKLQEQEVVDILTPEHPRHAEFHHALGFRTDKEAQVQCAQQ